MNQAVESSAVTTEVQMLAKEVDNHIKEMQLQTAASAAEISMHSSPQITQAPVTNNRRKSSTCDICGKIFSRYDNLERHRRTHQGEKLYNCDVCGKSFAQSSYLKVHYRTHSGERPFKCNICGYAFSRSDHLARHVRTHHVSQQVSAASEGKNPSTNKPATVQSPSLSQKQQEQLQVLSSQPCPSSNNNNSPHPLPSIEPCNHVHHRPQLHAQPNYPLYTRIVNNHSCATTKTANPDKDPKCASVCAGNNSSLCEAPYLISPSLPGNGLFNCDVCWKAFSQTPHGNIHKRIHSAVLPYQCEICSKSFSRRDNLKRHISTHDGLKLFSCEVCSKAFSRRAYLKVHHRIHTGERPYKCSICDYAFTRNDHLIRHNRPNKGERKFSCIPLNLKDCASNEPQQHLMQQNLSVANNTMTCPHTSNIANQNLPLVLSTTPSSEVTPASVHHTVLTSSSPSSSHHHHHHHRHHHHHHALHHAATCLPITQIFPTIQMSQANHQVFPSVQMSTSESYPMSSAANNSHKDIVLHQNK